MSKKTIQPQFSFETIDWTMVSQEKAELIYNEAKDLQREIWESFNVMNDKGFNLLALAMALTSTVIGYALVEWGKPIGPLLIAAFAFSGATFFSSIGFAICIWPRQISHASPEPMAYLANGFYMNPYLGLLQGNIRAICRSIDHNKIVESKRAFWLRSSLVILLIAPIFGVIGFLVTKLFW